MKAKTGSTPSRSLPARPAPASRETPQSNVQGGGRSSKNTAGSKKSIVVEEDRRIFFHKQLVEFRDSTELEISFPSSLSSTERKFIHRVVTELGLVSKSSGAGENRFITVRKRSALQATVDKCNSSRAIAWDVSPRALQFLSHQNDLTNAIDALKVLQQQTAQQPAQQASRTTHRHRLSRDVLNRLRVAHQEAETKRKQHASHAEIESKRRLLPAAHYRHAVTKIVADNQISLISGETGCGKSTQIPQFLLEDANIGPACRIVVTQPRRISAIALAERISSERSEEVGQSIGYNIRLESKQSANTQVLFVTPGVLLRKLIEDPELEEFSHVIVDEAHERDRYTEFLLILLRDICDRRKSLKMVLMSATMQTHKLKAYFGDIPQINVGGSVFPVQEFFLEHVLKFTNYSASSLSAVSATATGSARAAQRAVSYRCAICDKGPFLSAEELGTHAAQCFPPQPDTLLRHAQQRSSSRHTFLQELGERLRFIENAVRRETNAAPAVAGADATATTAANESENENNEPEGDKDAETESESGSDSEWDEDEDEMHSSQLADKSDVGKDKTLLSEESPEFHALLKQYQESQQDNDDSAVDLDLVVSLLKFVFQSEFGREGSVLVFLPGWDEISRLQRLLCATMEFNDPRKFLILQLHSGIPRQEQNLVFKSSAPHQRKIILSTNIAETSLTIDDVTVVVDAGKAKEKVYDPHTKLSFLKTSYISQASGRQRKGRAGRTRAGVCFHLYSVLRGKHLPEFQDSELLRMPLEELVLQAKCVGVAPGKGNNQDSVSSFLRKAMDPPHERSITDGISLLQSLHCMDENEALTDLGHAVSKLPMNPRLGKMLILGCVMGCGPAAKDIASVMSYRDPFILATNDVQRAHTMKIKQQFAQQSGSDQVAVYRALELFSNAKTRYGMGEARSFCEKHDLSLSTMLYLHDVCQQLNKQLQEIGIVCNQAKTSRNSGNVVLVSALLNSGLYPAVVMRQAGASLFSTEKGPKAKIHPSSINAKAPFYRSECKRALDLVSFQELIALNQHRSNSMFEGANFSMIGTSAMSVLSLLLTCGDLNVLPVEHDDSVDVASEVTVSVDSWFALKMPRATFELILDARTLIGMALVQYVNKPESVQGGVVGKALEQIFEALTEEQGQVNKIT